ncbi:GD13719 [Drosophila simulans]|uniref:GD13719 n=1 Tax=Drosophila simulans TaxID=7240 RepID=B4QP09_DROSI|nr:GD13719 [Drosophila simulans]
MDPTSHLHTQGALISPGSWFSSDKWVLFLAFSYSQQLEKLKVNSTQVRQRAELIDGLFTFSAAFFPSVLLFPPVGNYRRYLIHQTCEKYRQQYDLFTFSVGQGPQRRTVLCFRNQLLDPSGFENRKQQQQREKDREREAAKSWRSNNNSHYHTNGRSSSASIRSATELCKMGVKKHISETPLSKSNSVDLYRPPALRNNSNNNNNSSSEEAAAANEAITTPLAAGTATTASTSPTSKESPNREYQTDASAAAATRRERRPDRAVYVPRARRSQTTPPTTTTTTTAAAATAVATTAPAAAAVVAATITTAPDSPPVADTHPSKADDANGQPPSKSKKSKSHRERRERGKKTTATTTSDNATVLVISAFENDTQSNEEHRPAKPADCDKERHSPQASATAKPPADSTTEDDDEEDEDDWEKMFDESGDCLDPKILQELTESVGKCKIELPKMDYSVFHIKQQLLNEEEFPHVLEVSNFPVEFKTPDLLMLFAQYRGSGFDIKWVDDTHALAVFSSSRIAAEVLTMGHPFVKLKPLAEATLESRLKAKKAGAVSMQPYRQRPETCTALARRLVSGALGVKLPTAPQERENERRVLREAKERKLLAAKQRDEVWES